MFEILTVMPKEFWLFLTAVFGGIAGSLAYWWRKRTDFFYKEKKHIPEKVLPVLAALIDSLNIITSETDCNRAIILKCENSGGVPRVSTPLYSTGVLESHKTIKGRRVGWQKQPLDNVYIKMLINLQSAPMGFLSVNVSEVEGSSLHDIYLSDGVKFTELATLHTTKIAWYYISCTFPVDPEEFDPEERVIIREQVQAIRQILKDNSEIL